MNAVAVGLIGVIVSALLAEANSLIIDQAKPRARARAACQLIGAELSTAEKMASALAYENGIAGVVAGAPAGQSGELAASTSIQTAPADETRLVDRGFR